MTWDCLYVGEEQTEAKEFLHGHFFLWMVIFVSTENEVVGIWFKIKGVLGIYV